MHGLCWNGFEYGEGAAELGGALKTALSLNGFTR